MGKYLPKKGKVRENNECRKVINHKLTKYIIYYISSGILSPNATLTGNLKTNNRIADIFKKPASDSSCIGMHHNSIHKSLVTPVTCIHFGRHCFPGVVSKDY